VQMVDRLARVGARVDHDSIASVELKLFGQPADDVEQVPQQSRVGR